MNTPGTTLILLVGSNPLPNYLSAWALRPSRLALIYTPETKDASDRLKAQLRAVPDLDGVSIVEQCVRDAASATEVRRKVANLMQSSEPKSEIWLNYTGGTKVMAAHARIAYGESGGLPKNASYLDEGGSNRQACLRFDDGTSNLLSQYSRVSLDLCTILALHGISHKPREAKESSPTAQDARHILHKVVSQVCLAKDLYKEKERLEKMKVKEAVNDPFEPDKFELQLSLLKLPPSDVMDEKAYKHWYKFIGGEWLEEWLGEQIRTLDLKPTAEITVGFDAFRGSKRAQLQVDIAVVHSHRSYFISCTTDKAKDRCKSKLFEIVVRSRQLGGDLSRAALVCLADDSVVSALKSDIDDVWGASNTTRVFGLSDVFAWSDRDGKQPNLHSLKTWLES
ncbi:MAG TPA: hypothetical protein V6D08_17485 [Candidatus Obscuribacterales bacterium]